MKKVIFLIVLSFTTVHFLYAQSAPSKEPVYKTIPSIPPFEIFTAPDSIPYKKENLKKRKKTILIVFSPDCGHCINATKDMLEHFDKFKKVQIVMASPMAYSEVLKFYNDLNLKDYQNIKVGFDRGYFLGTFFEVRSFPAIFLYDKKGNFKKTFGSDTPFETIAKSL